MDFDINKKSNVSCSFGVVMFSGILDYYWYLLRTRWLKGLEGLYLWIRGWVMQQLASLRQLYFFIESVESFSLLITNFDR